MSGQSKSFNSTSDYVASQQLLASVNVAIALKKPLLVKGDPGTVRTCCTGSGELAWQEIDYLEYKIYDKGAGRTLYV